MSEPLLQVRNLSVSFILRQGLLNRSAGTVKAVDRVNLELQEGETLALVGESGCGKTTLGRALLRLVEPSDGEILYRGMNLLKISSPQLTTLRRELQMIFQDPYSSLNPRKRILDIIGEPLLIHGLAVKKDLSDKVLPLLEKVGLPPEAAGKFPHEFSGGQRQRISIARAIALNPAFILCDEPVSALDVSIQAQIINLLIQLQREMGLSYLFISHDLAVVRSISSRVMVMYLGQILEQGPTEDIFASPGHPYTRILQESVPRLGQRHIAAPISGETPSPSNPPRGCPFHPRCPMARRECSISEPPVKIISDQHWYRCFF